MVKAESDCARLLGAGAFARRQACACVAQCSAPLRVVHETAPVPWSRGNPRRSLNRVSKGLSGFECPTNPRDLAIFDCRGINAPARSRSIVGTTQKHIREYYGSLLVAAHPSMGCRAGRVPPVSPHAPSTCGCQARHAPLIVRCDNGAPALSCRCAFLDHPQPHRRRRESPRALDS